MNETDLLRDYCRMCDMHDETCMFNGENCPLLSCRGKIFTGTGNCREWVCKNPEKVAEIVKGWAREHHLKTRQDVFLERYPNAVINDGAIIIEPCVIEKGIIKCDTKGCINCMKEYWLAPAE